MKIEWEFDAGRKNHWFNLKVDGKFLGILGQYPGYWLFTTQGSRSVIFDNCFSIDEAKTAAVVAWRMTR